MIRNRLLCLSLAVLGAVGGIGSASAAAASAGAKGAKHSHEVVIAKPTAKRGEKCGNRVSGCSHGKFTGKFFR